jgi:glycosyltransferase involved in cell wall biosynthesis
MMATDQTALVAEQAGRPGGPPAMQPGKTAAMQAGLHKALDFSPQVVVVLDGDGQHHPEDIPALIQPILAGDAHIVVGSRFLRKRSHIPLWRIFGQHGLTLATNLLSGVPLTDSQSGFRAFSPNVLALLNFSQSGFAVESEIQFLAHQYGLVIKEVPIGVTYAEKSKRSPVAHGLQILNSLLFLVGQHRPLLFFGVPGLAALLAGMGLGAYVVQVYNQTQSLAVGYAMLTVMLTILGATALFAGLMLHSMRGLIMEISQKK